MWSNVYFRRHHLLGAAFPILFSLCLGVCCTSAVLSAIARLLLFPVPSPVIERVVFLGGIVDHPLQDAVDWWSRSRTLEQIAHYRAGAVTVQIGATESLAQATFVSPSIFPILGARVTSGRILERQDVVEGHRVVVVAAHYARARWGYAAPIDQIVRINNVSYQVIGVLADGFTFPGRTDLWLARPHGALSSSLVRQELVDGRAPLLVPADGYLGLLRLGVTREQCAAELKGLLQALDRESIPEGVRAFGPGSIVTVRPFRQVYGRSERLPLVLLLLGGVLLLGSATVSASSVLLAGAFRRRTEFAIREALGASRLHLWGHIAAESIMLGTIGGGLSLCITSAATLLLHRFGAAYLPIGVDLSFGDGMLWLTSLLTGLTAGGMVAVSSLINFRRLSGHSVLQGRRHAQVIGYRLRRTLIVCQVGLSFSLCAVGLNAISSYRTGQGVAESACVRQNGLFWFRLRIKDPARVLALREQVLLTTGQIDRRTQAAVVDHVWWMDSGAGGFQYVTYRGRSFMCRCTRIGGRYFEATGTDLRSGSGFQPGHEDQAVVDESFARQVGDGRILGSSLLVGGDSTPKTIVGVVRHVSSFGGGETSEAQCYLPVGGRAANPASRPMIELLVYAAGRPAGLVASLRQDLGKVPGVSVYSVTAVSEAVASGMAPLRAQAMLLIVFALIAGALSVVGIHSMLSTVFSARRQEMAIRVALGATPTDIVKTVLTEGVVLTAAGLGFGVVVSGVLGGYFASQIVQMRFPDPSIALMLAFGFILTSLIAAVPVAQQVILRDPATVLGAE